MNYFVKAEEFMRLIAEYNKIKKENNSVTPDKGTLAVMGILSCNKEMCANELAKQLNISRARLSLIVKKLKKKNYITSRFQLNDKRKSLIKITEEGSRVVQETVDKTLNRISTIFEKVGEEKTLVAFSLLETVIEICKDDEKGELVRCLD